MPPDASVDGHRIDALLRLVSWVTAGALALTLLAFALALLSKRRTLSTATGSVAGVLALVLVIELLIGLRARRDLDHRWSAPRGPDVVRVEVTARRFSWQFRLAGDDDLFGTPDDVVTLDDVTLPAGRPVVMALRSRDVVHGLYIPQLRARSDAIPGRTTHLWFTAARPAEVEAACSSLCGPAHYQMRAALHLVSPADFTARTHALSAEQRRRREAATDAGAGAREDDLAWPWTPP